MALSTPLNQPIGNDLTDLTIAELGALLARRALSPVELVEAALARIEELDPKLHAFITVTADLARARAREAERRIAAGGYRGGLDGVPYSLKDVIETAGVRTTSHSKLLIDNVPGEDAPLAARLAGAGGILLGKNATWEFAHGGPSWDLPWPLPVNPWSPQHLPGGSSSGSAAAVSARLVPAAIGTDTGGSVRWPAAVCGIVGLKPTYGRISRRGVHANSVSLDHCGTLTRTVEDAAIVLSAVAGHDPSDPGSIDEPVPDYRAALTGSIGGLRVGLVRHWYAQDAEPEVTQAVDSAVAQLAALGAKVEEVELASLVDYSDCKNLITMSEVYDVHQAKLRTRPQDFGKSLRTRALAGAFIPARDYVQAQRWRADLTTKMLATFARFDVLVSAGWLGFAEPNDPDDADAFKKRPLVTMPHNVTGIPALALPCGFSEAGLPLSLQIAGRPFDEATVLRVGDAYQRATAWHRRTPPLAWTRGMQA